jgi:hypothetical protein
MEPTDMDKDIRFIGKREPIEKDIIDQYYQKAIDQLQENFDIEDDYYHLVQTVRKYTFDKSYLCFTFFGEDANYDVIYQRDGRGNNKRISTYLVESIGEKGMITKIYILSKDHDKKLISGNIAQTPLALKVESIINELEI